MGRAEIFVLGLGRESVPVPQAVQELFQERGILLDACDTVNACQLFNVLNSEDRAVAAGLIPLEPPS